MHLNVVSQYNDPGRSEADKCVLGTDGTFMDPTLSFKETSVDSNQTRQTIIFKKRKKNNK